MKARAIAETERFQLSSQQRISVKVTFSSLAQLAHSQDLQIDFPIQLTQAIQKQLGRNAEQLPLQTETSTFWKLTLKPKLDPDP